MNEILGSDKNHLLQWWAKLIHRIIIAEAKKKESINHERKDQLLSSGKARLCLRPSVDVKPGVRAC